MIDPELSKDRNDSGRKIVPATQCSVEVQIFPEKVWLDSGGGLSPNLEFGAKSLQTLPGRPAAPNWVRIPPGATSRAHEVESDQV